MEKIILIKKLETCNSKTLFGYVGRSIETGKIKYYFFSNKKDDNPNLLQEFDINNINHEYLATCLNDCNFERPKFSSLLPAELEELLHIIIDKHTTFNKDNGYPTNWIDINKTDLSVQILKSNTFRRTRPAASRYNSLENVIELRITANEWKILTSKEKERTKSHLIHEVGHLKAAKYYLVGNILNVQTGFSIKQYYTSPIRLENGDILYNIDGCVPKDVTQVVVERSLEEIMNDYDCSIVIPSFYRNYPKFGEQLNDLCEAKLSLIARYKDGINTYYNEFCSIIPNKDLATELLETIYASIYGTSKEATEERARQLIKRYEHTKDKKIC